MSDDLNPPASNPNSVDTTQSLFFGVAYLNGSPVYTVGAIMLEDVAESLRCYCLVRLIGKNPGGYLQVRILDNLKQIWLDPDGGPADHPEGWCNVELRLQMGRQPV